MNNISEIKKEGNILKGFFSLVALIVVGFGAWFLWGGKKVESPSQNLPETIPLKNENSPLNENTSIYKDGTYSVTGNYISPGGSESVGVTLTLNNGKIIDSIVTPEATRNESKRWQNVFVENYKQYVIGKNIDEVKLDRVSGSSLTSGGFNDALSKIRNEAKM